MKKLNDLNQKLSELNAKLEHHELLADQLEVETERLQDLSTEAGTQYAMDSTPGYKKIWDKKLADLAKTKAKIEENAAAIGAINTAIGSVERAIEGEKSEINQKVHEKTIAFIVENETKIREEFLSAVAKYIALRSMLDGLPAHGSGMVDHVLKDFRMVGGPLIQQALAELNFESERA